MRRFLELIRFSHTIFALPFALLASVWAIVIPADHLELTALQFALRGLGVVLCMVAARSAAMAFNRLVDSRLDRQNPRTATRHIPTGALTARQVWIFFAATCLLLLGSCLLFLPNWLPLALAMPLLVWICGYSLAKRFTSASHLWLGIALALSPVCAWIAIRGEQVWMQPADLFPAMGLGVAIALWVAGFDIIYACQDAEFDRSVGLHSIPARSGVAGALKLAAGLHGAMLIVLTLLPLLFAQLSLSWIYYIALGVVACLIVRQHTLVKADDLMRANIAFFNVNAIISIVLALAACSDAILR